MTESLNQNGAHTYPHQAGEVDATALSMDIAAHPEQYHPGLDPHMEANGITVTRPQFEDAAVEAAETGLVRPHDWLQISTDVPLSPIHEQEHHDRAASIDPSLSTRPPAERRAIETVIELGGIAEDTELTALTRQAEIEQPARPNKLGATFVTNQERLSEIRKIGHIPPDAKLKDLLVIDHVDHSRVAATVDGIARNRGFEGSRKAWQERVFGETDVELLQKDIQQHIESPHDQRRGEPLIVNGKERRPILDIAIDTATQQEVAAVIAERERGLDSLRTELQAIRDRNETIFTSRAEELMYAAKVLGRPHTKILESQNHGGTIADLYLDSEDLEKFDAIDQLALELLPKGDSAPSSSRERLAGELLILASNSFPSGVEFMHGINKELIGDVVEHGAVAPRSQRKHGVSNGSGGSLNGAFVHMTGPGGFASEYGTVVAGISIDTIVQHSPYMQLEDAYIGNSHTTTGQDGETIFASTQYHMGAVELNGLDEAPLAFKAAFQTMHRNIQDGLTHAGIGQGDYDNYSFAAGDTVATAANYSYPLAELSLYANGLDESIKIFDAAAKIDKTQEIAERTTVICSQVESETRSANQFQVDLNVATLPNFDLTPGRPIRFYAPLSSREVPFTETSAGNSQTERAIVHTLETVKADAIPAHVDGLIADGMLPAEAVSASIDAVNNHGGDSWDLVKSYIGGKEVFDQNGISAASIFDGISDQAITSTKLERFIANLREETPPDPAQFTENARRQMSSWVVRGQYASRAVKQELMQTYADRLFAASRSAYAVSAPFMIAFGVSVTTEQQTAIADYEAALAEEQQRQSERGFAPPPMPGF